MSNSRETHLSWFHVALEAVCVGGHHRRRMKRMTFQKLRLFSSDKYGHAVRVARAQQGKSVALIKLLQHDRAKL